MKKSFIYSSFILLLFVFGACKKDSLWEKTSVKLTPIYQLTNITGTDPLYSVEIYKEKPLVIEFINVSLASSYVSSNYTDNSTATNFNVLVTKNIEKKEANGAITKSAEKYEVTGVKDTNSGNLKVTAADGVTVRNYGIKIQETTVYN